MTHQDVFHEHFKHSCHGKSAYPSQARTCVCLIANIHMHIIVSVCFECDSGFIIIRPSPFDRQRVRHLFHLMVRCVKHCLRLGGTDTP